MLHEFLIQERVPILALCKEKAIAVGAANVSTPELEVGLPIFLR